MKLVAVRKNQEGKITHFLTDKNRMIPIDEAEQLVQRGEIDSLSEIHADGSWVIDTLQHLEGNNLTELPEF